MGNVVCLIEGQMIPTKWPLIHVIAVHPGVDGKVRVVTVQTKKGTYKRPITKIVALINET